MEKTSFDEVIVVDGFTLKIRHASDGALANLGYVAREVEGCDISMIGDDYALPLLSHTCAASRAALAKTGMVTEHRRRDGVHYRVRSRILSRDGPSPYFVILANRLS
jgi:hypothetical protein